MAVHWQPSLFGSDEGASYDAALRGLRRVDLDTRSWVDHLPGWLGGSDALMAEMAEQAPWAPQRKRHMYERIVDEPRIVAPYSSLEDLPPVVDGMRRVLSEHYGVLFDSVLVNLYRDGRDSVAWQATRCARCSSTRWW